MFLTLLFQFFKCLRSFTVMSTEASAELAPSVAVTVREYEATLANTKSALVDIYPVEESISKRGLPRNVERLLKE